MAKRLLSSDPLTGIKTYHHYDYQSDVTTIESVQNIEPILTMNKEAAKEADYQGNGIKSGWWHAGTIPNIIIEKWLNEDGIDFFNRDHWKAVKAKLNSPEWRYLRTGRGKL
jgi:hypothetical protein